ncbi:MAG: hypothetical protein H6815_04570 [Phycisphaeraceae bacterium]|nr:hypothetical protein [Phycisphaerales bacterium]MCB9859707.1 hypothetical protein [Phycisphaeraceae bacterium]
MMYARTLAAALMLGATCAASAQTTYDVALDGADFVYNSQTNMNIDLQINVGDTVRWTWISGRHNVVSGTPGSPMAGSVFSSGGLALPPMVYEFTFDTPGTYDYFCEAHAGLGMVSQVVVLDSVCYADCDGSGSLNIFDYICFGNEYAAGTTYADCDGSGSLNIFDYICFGNEYAAGCP